MNFDDQARLELSELCHALADGVLNGTQRVRLEEMLTASEEARRFYVQAMALSASLYDYAGEMQSEAADAPIGWPANERPAALWWAIGSLAAAAAVALAFWLGGWARPGGASDVAASERDSDETVARLSGSKNCQWSGPALQPGDDLHRGQRIELLSGTAEITFDSGAQVTLEGPASLNLDSEWEAALQSGTLKATVPAEAIGFRVSNPAVDVVDPGTEFSMVADTGGATEVFVTKGAVEVQSREEAQRSEPGLVLRENQARRFAGSGASEVRDRDRKVARLSSKVALDRFMQPAGYFHWTFDETDGARFAGLALGSAHGECPASVEAAPGFDLSGMRGEGRFRGAARFDGSIFANATFQGLAQRTARTAALWVKLPPDAPLSQAGALLSWPLRGANGPAVEVAWNRNPDQGALGALRTKGGRGVVVGTTPLRDGRWHHLAVVLSPNRKADGLQIRQYVDGRLEGVSAKRGAKRAGARSIATTGVAALDTLWIGRSLDGTRFHGEIDELFIADRALAPQEIRQLMLRNQPALPETLAAR